MEFGNSSNNSMRTSGLALAAAAILLFGVCTMAAPSESGSGTVHGAVVDESGGVLPGVTVSAVSEDGRVLATAVTDRVGQYAFEALPEGTVHLTFQLEGFAIGSGDVTIGPGRDAAVAPQRLLLAARSENVTVQGKTPVVAIASPYVPPPPNPPPPLVVSVPQHDRDSICGPAMPDAAREPLGTIRSRRRAAGAALYVRNDEVVIDGGTAEHLTVGQNLVARRAFRVPGDSQGATGEHTAGVVQIVSASEHTSVGVVIYACDELMQGDWLAPFAPEPIRAAEPAGTPAYDDAAKILYGDAGQIVGAPGRLMVIDRGRNHGIQPGQRMTLFRRSGSRRSIVGDAVVVAVRFESATIRIVRATDVIEFGDWAAPQRYMSASRR
jgi:carboxypeptidase family protein